VWAIKNELLIIKQNRCLVERWLGHENIPNPSKTGRLCNMNSVKAFIAEWFGQAASTGFKKCVQEIVFSLYVFRQIIILENTNLRVPVCAVAN